MNHTLLDTRITALSSRFEGAFDAETPSWRTIGREAEFPVVDAEGHAASVPAILARLAERPDARVQREGELITGMDLPGLELALEVGHGTIELITGPAPDLDALEALHEAGLAQVKEAAAAEGARLLGTGMQPRTPASSALMSPKARYQALLNSVGPGWLWFTSTASDQVHVDIGRDELWALTNLANLLAPLTVALCANSAVHGGADEGVCSMREWAMGTIGADACRHGMSAGPVSGTTAFVGGLVDQPYLLAWQGNEKVENHGTFREWLAARPRQDADADWRDYLLHEHYVWHSARPRSAQSTLELRSACQQPPGASMAAAALGLGIVEAGTELAHWIEAELGADAWPAMRTWHHAVVRDGLAADAPFAELVPGALARIDAALVARGRGEERHLAPLHARWQARENPAQVARRQVAESGVHAFIDTVSL